MKKHLIVIFIIALAARLVYLFLLSPGQSVHIDEWSYYQLVTEFWFSGSSPDFIHHPPLYFLFILMAFKVFSISLLALQLIQAVLGALSAALVALIGRQVAGSRVGLISGLGYALSVRPIRMPAEILSETLFTFLLILAVWVFIKALKGLLPQRAQRPRSDREVSAKRTQSDDGANTKKFLVTFVSFVVDNGFYFLLVFSGMLFGLAALTRSIALGLPFLLAFYLIIVRRNICHQDTKTQREKNLYSYSSCLSALVAGGKKFSLVGIFILAFSLPLIPWVMRTHRITHRFMPGSASYGITFFWHNTDLMWQPGSDYIRDLRRDDFNKYSTRLGWPIPQEYYHPSIKQMQNLKPSGLTGESDGARFYFNYTLDHLKTLSGWGLAKLELVKLYRLILPFHPYYNPFPDLTGLIILVFFSLFLYYLVCKKLPADFTGPGMMVILLLIGYLVLTALVFGGMPRYRDPFDPYLVILAAAGAERLFYQVRQKNNDKEKRTVRLSGNHCLFRQ